MNLEGEVSYYATKENREQIMKLFDASLTGELVQLGGDMPGMPPGQYRVLEAKVTGDCFSWTIGPRKFECRVRWEQS